MVGGRLARAAAACLSLAANLSRAACLRPVPERARPSTENDILWRAKRNAFRQALLQHRVSEAEACAILEALIASGRGGCELVCLARLTGLEDAVLDRALPLMGLQNIVAIEERPTGVRRRPVVWVVATDGGRRFVREAASALVSTLRAPGVAAEAGDGSGGPRGGTGA